MDLANRIKFFINTLGIGSSQFADNCNIPRPTLSQILNGRNKKISDELIGKIHQAYPSLSVLWLMFGEGEMLINENIKISEPKEGETIDFESTQPSDSQVVTSATVPQNSILDFDSENSFSQNLFKHQQESPQNTHPDDQTDKTDNPSTPVSSNVCPASTTSSGINISPDQSKTIVNIMVFYSDNSFESFTPVASKSK